jgi:hypothetical protein
MTDAHTHSQKDTQRQLHTQAETHIEMHTDRHTYMHTHTCAHTLQPSKGEVTGRLWHVWGPGSGRPASAGTCTG